MLSIGEFSKLCMVTTKTLRHYDSIGLLRPLEQGEENGYRYYGVEQLNTMLRIMRLKDYGFSLEEIRDLLNSDEGTLSRAMSVKHRELKMNLEKEAMILARLRQDIDDVIEGVFMKNQLQISLVEVDPVNIASVRETIAIKDFNTLFGKLYALGLPCQGPPIAIYHCPDFNPEATDVELGFPTNATSENTRTLDGGLMVKGTHYGDYAYLHESYMELGKYVESNGYKVRSAPYEKYIHDSANTPKEQLITEIYFPVSK